MSAIKVGGLYLVDHKGIPGNVFVFQVVAKSKLDNGSHAFLGVKISKGSFVVGCCGMATAWFSQDGREIDPVLEPGYRVYGTSKSKSAPVDF